jgi:hypothetical protein
MLYEIINPSDAYTMDVPDLEVAAVAIALLGEGRYGLQPLEEGGEHIPIFMAAGDEWFTEHFSRDLTQTYELVTTTKRTELADAFDSVIIGGKNERFLYLKAVDPLTEADRRAFRKEWLDKRRSSMNNIGGRAWALAEHFRKERVNDPNVA